MKKLLITYRMTNDFCCNETCVALPMSDKIADDLLENGGTSAYLELYNSKKKREGKIRHILQELASIQGYDYAGFCSAELLEK